MSSPASSPAAARIRQLIHARAQAVLVRNVAGVTAFVGEDVVAFDASPPLRTRGAEAVRARAQAWLAGYAEGPRYDVYHLTVEASGTVAFAHYVYRVRGRLATGEEVDMAVRATLGLLWRDGDWSIVHAHDSVPFDPESGKALVEMDP